MVEIVKQKRSSGILNCFLKVELQFAIVRVDLPEQTKWLLHNRILRQRCRKYFVTVVRHKRARCPNTKLISTTSFFIIY